MAQYAQDSLQNARDLIKEAKILMASECWARACSLAVLGSEEAAKGILAGLMPLLPPADASELLAWPFNEVNTRHDLKLGLSAVMTHIVRQVLSGSAEADGLAPTEETIKLHGQDRLDGEFLGELVGDPMPRTDARVRHLESDRERLIRHLRRLLAASERGMARPGRALEGA